MIHHSWRTAGLLLAGSLAVAGLAGCGSSAGSSASTGSTGSAVSGSAASPAVAAAVNVCSLLPAKQASAAVGVTYTTATSSSNGTMCSYATTDAPIPMFVIVSSGSGAAAWKEAVATLQEDGGETPLNISGIGDRAEGDGTQFDVQSGSWIIDVHGGDPNGTGAAFPKSEAVAKVIMAGLH
jgi:hypothetical protein